METFWSLPCTYATDLYVPHFVPAGNPAGFYDGRAGCQLKNKCPTGLSATKIPPATAVTTPGLCNFCNTLLLSGCHPFALGVQGALGVLAAINFCGTFSV